MPSRLAKYALAPAFVLQGLRLRRHMPKLPEPPGPRRGSTGHGRPLGLLIAGDSSAAGVGAPHQSAALSGQLVGHLAPHYQLTWQLEARTGDTTAMALKRLQAVPRASFDVAVLALGVNDITSGMRRSRWLKQQRTLYALLRQRFDVRRIYVSGLPPVRAFPALPPTMRRVLGAEADRFDHGLAALCAETTGAEHVPFDGQLDRSVMSEDGFHPGPAVYKAWSDAVAQRVFSDFPPTS